MLTPRKWQQEALNIWLETYKGVVSVVTGGGKTIFAELCIEQFFIKYPKGQVLIIVPTLALLDQWVVSLVEDAEYLEQDIAIFSGQEKSKVFKKINLIVINTGRTLNPSIDNQTMIIVDECHRAGSIENAKSLFLNCDSALGLSATPKRQYDDGFERFIKPVLGKIIYEYSYNDALRDEVICPFELINVQVDLLPDELRNYEKITKKIAIEYSKKELDLEKIRILLEKRSVISAQAKMRVPVTAKIIETQKNQRSVIFFERISQADKLYEVLIKRNKSVTRYHSKLPPLIRRENLRLFKKRVYDILITCKALDEGLNIPDATIAVIGSSTSSIRQRIQRMGRVLRPYPGKNNAIIYTLFATEPEKRNIISIDHDLESSSTTLWFRGTSS